MRLARILFTVAITSAVVSPAVLQPPPPPPPPEEAHDNSAPPPPPSYRGSESERFAELRSMGHRVMAVRAEAEELYRREEVLNQRLADTAARLAAKEIDEERASRIRKIVELRREALPLERAEFVAEAREKSALALEEIRRAKTAALSHNNERAAAAIDRFEERVGRIHESTTDFESLYREMEKMPTPREEFSGLPLDVRSREIEELRDRLDRLEEEFGQNRRERSPRRGSKDRMSPDDAAEFPGMQDTPPAQDMRERRQRDRRTENESESK